MNFLRVIASADLTKDYPVEGGGNNIHKLMGFGHTIDVAPPNIFPTAWLWRFNCILFSRKKSQSTYAYLTQFPDWLAYHVTNYGSVVIQRILNHHTTTETNAFRKHHIYDVIFLYGKLDHWLKEPYYFKNLKKLLYWLVLLKNNLRNDQAAILSTDKLLQPDLECPNLYICKKSVINYGAIVNSTDSFLQIYTSYHAFPALIDKQSCIFISGIY